MKTLRLVPFVTVLVVGGLFTACSSDPDPTPVTVDAGDDSAKDSGVAETKADTKPPLEVGVCDKPLPSAFTCSPPTKTAGGITCSEDDIQGQLAACWTPLGGDKTKCAAWQSAHGACQKCLATWTYSNGKPNRDACYYRVMTTTCADAVKCYFDCINEVCVDCASDPTEYTDCQARAKASTGACYANSYKQASAEKCFDGTGVIDPCVVDELAAASPDKTKLGEQLAIFYRGACRDNGDWSKATTGGGDAGTDASTDGATDGGASDAATDGG